MTEPTGGQPMQPPPGDPIPFESEFVRSTGMHLRMDWIPGDDNDGNALEVAPSLNSACLVFRCRGKYFTVDVQDLFRKLHEKVHAEEAADASPSKSMSTEDVTDVLLLVYGGGGCIGLTDPDPEKMAPIIDRWSHQTREAVCDYAGAVHAVAGDNDDVEIPPKPQALIDLCDELGCQFA